MMLMQQVGVGYYLYAIALQCQVCVLWLNTFNFKIVPGYQELGLVPLCILNETNIYQFAGLSLQFLILEVFCVIMYLSTMVILLLKS